MGAFDDLIPEKKGGGFDDLIPPQRTTGEKVKGAVSQFGQGINETIANVAGAPVDALAWGLRQAGLPVTDPIGGSASIMRLMPAQTAPEGTVERTARGAGAGVGNALSVMLPAGLVARGATGLTQGVANALRTQPVTQTVAGGVGGGVEGATDSPLLGLAAGVAVPVAASVGRGIVSPNSGNYLTAQEQRLVQAADREGVPLTPAQRTGNPSLQTIEETMAKTPGPAGPMKRTLLNQRQEFNRAGLQRAGVTARDASPDTLDRAFTNIGQTFDDLASRTTLFADPQFAADLQAVSRDYVRRLPTDVAPVVQSYIDDFVPFIQQMRTGGALPQIDGAIYARIRSDLGKRIRGSHNNPDLQEALAGIQTALDDMVERSVGPNLRGEWQEVRRQYQALMTIDRAMMGGTQADRSAGNIPLGGLTQSVRQSDPRGYSRGDGQLNELSRIGDFIGQRVPDSGTPARLATLNPLMWPALAGHNVFSRVYNSPLGTAYFGNTLAGTTDFPALYGGELARRALEEAQGRNALSRGGGR